LESFPYKLQTTSYILHERFEVFTAVKIQVKKILTKILHIYPGHHHTFHGKSYLHSQLPVKGIHIGMPISHIFLEDKIKLQHNEK